MRWQHELKNNIRSGSIWVEGSRMHKEFEEYLISKEEWEVVKQTKKCLAVNLNFEEYIKEKMETLNARLKWISKNIDQVDSINVDKKKIYVERLQTDVPEDARAFSLSLYKRLPRVKLTELLMEVAEWTGFD